MIVRSAVALAVVCIAGLGCASTAPSKNEELFQTVKAKRALESAPDLFAAAQRSWDAAAEREEQDDEGAADDYRTRSRLLLAAAVAETERIALEGDLDAVLREEAKWLATLHGARTRAFAAEQANSRKEAQRVAEQRAEEARALAAKAEASRMSREERDKVGALLLDRAALLLATAEALGADEAELRALRDRHAALSGRGEKDPESVEFLLWDVHRLVGASRAQRVEPPPGTGDALLTAAEELSMQTERRAHGTEVWTESALRNDRANARVVRHMGMLVDAFPHGPVSCRVTGVPPRKWKRVYDDLRPLEERHVGRVSLSPGYESVGEQPLPYAESQELRCTFIGYTAP